MIQIQRFVAARPRVLCACGLVLFSALYLAAADPAAACRGTPPPPFCGKSLVLGKAVPGVVLLPGGGTFGVPSVVFLSIVDFPPGSGVCPPGPYSATVSLTATCFPAPGGGGTVTIPVTSGAFTPVTVPVTVGAGPPRLCFIAGTATTTLSDGMVLTAAGDSVVCLAEPSPADPSIPRLDLQPLVPDSEIAAVHPGDQASYTYVITNNDPAESFTGVLDVDMVNSARMPGASGPMPPGTGPFSISDPVEGDNFPIAFEDDLFEGCIVLPDDPTDPTIPLLTEPIALGPGESMEIDIFARPWGMCADGSCGEGKLVLEGEFSDSTPGLACAGFVTAADSSVPPSYLWPDSGQVTVVGPPMQPNAVTLIGSPRPTTTTAIDFVTTQAQLFVNGLPAPLPPEFFSDAVDPELGRTQVQFFDPDGINPFSIIDLIVDLDVLPTPGQMIEPELVEMQLVAGAPTGFQNISPVGDGLIEIRPLGDPLVDSFVEFTYQVEVVAIDNFGERLKVAFDEILMAPRPDGGGFHLQLFGGIPEPSDALFLQAIELSQDFRGFASEIPQGRLGEIFTDGFESGDTSAWSGSSGSVR